MDQTEQNTRIRFRPWMFSIIWLYAGAVICTMILAIESPEFKSMVLIVLYGLAPIVICVVIVIVLSPTPEWSSTAKRLCGIGFIVIGTAYSIAEMFHNTFYGLSVCIIGIIVLLIATLYPGAMLGYADTEQPE